LSPTAIRPAAGLFISILPFTLSPIYCIMITLPTEFPPNALTTAVGIVTSGQLLQKERTFATCVLTFGAYFAGVALKDAAANAHKLAKPKDGDKPHLTPEQKLLCEQFAQAITNVSLRVDKHDCSGLSRVCHGDLTATLSQLEQLGATLPRYSKPGE